MQSETYRADQIWHEYNHTDHISEDEEESQEGDHVGGKPQGQQLHEAIPLYNSSDVLFSPIFVFDIALEGAYIVPEDVVRDVGLVHAGVLVRPQVDEGFFGDALVCGHL
jgi:hypothetical protein